MEINNDDKRLLIAELDDRYVLKSDCNDKTDKINDKYTSVDLKVELASHDLSIIKKLLWLLVSASVSSLMVTILEFIFK